MIFGRVFGNSVTFERSKPKFYWKNQRLNCSASHELGKGNTNDKPYDIDMNEDPRDVMLTRCPLSAFFELNWASADGFEAEITNRNCGHKFTAKMSLLILTGPTMGKVTELNNISTETLIQRFTAKILYSVYLRAYGAHTEVILL